MAISYWKDPVTGKLISSADPYKQNALVGTPNSAAPGSDNQSLQQYLEQFSPESPDPVTYSPGEGIPQIAPTPMQQEAPVAAPIAEAPAADPWEQIATSYGLGAPPAQGLPTTLPDIQIGPAPQAQASLIDTSQIPQPVAQQMPVSDTIKQMESGQGYAPDILARMRANAVQDASNAGLQEMGQTKRVLGQAGVRGGAAAGVIGDVARRTGQAQSRALGDIDINNAQVGNQNRQFGIGQETSIGMGNQQAANAMALASASQMFSGLQSNQTAQNNTNQMNTGMAFQRQNDQASVDFNNEKSQWDELNKRYGQSQNILGSWGAAA